MDVRAFSMDVRAFLYYNNYIQYIDPLVIDLGLLSALLIPHHDLMPLDT
jgi:hypothetical protein